MPATVRPSLPQFLSAEMGFNNPVLGGVQSISPATKPLLIHYQRGITTSTESLDIAPVGRRSPSTSSQPLHRLHHQNAVGQIYMLKSEKELVYRCSSLLFPLLRAVRRNYGKPRKEYWRHQQFRKLSGPGIDDNNWSG
ncbi:uncharacterized protein LOC116245938 isoform X2 [Nymphaea colorata]|uniref:uncharacterized protein LOC116245938 isoform X2 n=1 Tax=Nymphaea colorata TaxID=210225 RepID=UPI00129EB2A7|nr:uncharacterized protein LOC116245938 isoform X2 [Nymphaea colorata]